MRSLLLILFFFFLEPLKAGLPWVFVEDMDHGCIRHIAAHVVSKKPTEAELEKLIPLKTYTYFLVNSLFREQKRLYFVGHRVGWSFKCNVRYKIGRPHKIFKRSKGACDSDLCQGIPVYCQDVGEMKSWVNA